MQIPTGEETQTTPVEPACPQNPVRIAAPESTTQGAARTVLRDALHNARRDDVLASEGGVEGRPDYD